MKGHHKTLVALNFNPQNFVVKKIDHSNPITIINMKPYKREVRERWVSER
jgi:hypothetical protein